MRARSSLPCFASQAVRASAASTGDPTAILPANRFNFALALDTAREAGIAEETLRIAFDDVRFVPRVVDLDRRQPEFTQTVWDYLDRAVSEQRVARGREKLAEFSELSGGCLVRCQARSFGFDQDAHRQQAVREAGVELPVLVRQQRREQSRRAGLAKIVDLYAAAWKDGDQSLGGKIHQRFVQHWAADAQRSGEIAFRRQTLIGL